MCTYPLYSIYNVGASCRTSQLWLDWCRDISCASGDSAGKAFKLTLSNRIMSPSASGINTTEDHSMKLCCPKKWPKRNTGIRFLSPVIYHDYWSLRVLEVADQPPLSVYKMLVMKCTREVTFYIIGRYTCREKQFIWVNYSFLCICLGCILWTIAPAQHVSTLDLGGGHILSAVLNRCSKDMDS